MSEGRRAYRWNDDDLRTARIGDGGFEAAVISRIMQDTAAGLSLPA
jgi:hypothetical protein